MLLSDFSWPSVFAPVEPDKSEATAVFDEDTFLARLASYVSACSHHNETLAVKAQKEHQTQSQYESLFLVEPEITHLEGRCKCGKLVKANVSRIEAFVDESACDRLRLGMEGIYLQNTGDVFHSLFHELVAELELASTVAPLVFATSSATPPDSASTPPGSAGIGASSTPSRRVPGMISPLQVMLRQLLFVVNSLMDVIAMPTASPSSRNACKGLVLTVCRAAYAGVLRSRPFSEEVGAPAALVEQHVQVKNLWKDFSRWNEVERALRSSATMDGEAIHLAHSFLLQRLVGLGHDCGWAAEMVSPGIAQIANRWLNEALMGGERVRPEEVLLVAVSRFPVKEIVFLSPETVQSFVMLPVQKALEFYAEQSYYRLASVLGNLLVRVAHAFPTLVSKCLAILTRCPPKFLPVCSEHVAALPWEVAVEEDLEDLLGALLGIIPALTASEYARLSHADRTQHRVALLRMVLNVQQERNSLEHSVPALGPSVTRFAQLVAFSRLFPRFPQGSAFASLIVQELMFFSLYRVASTDSLPLGLTKSLQQEAAIMFEGIASRVPIDKIGSGLIESVLADLESQSIDAESIALLMCMPCFSSWVPSNSDLRQLAYLTDHRSLDFRAPTGAQRIDDFIEQLFLGGPNVGLNPNVRGWATRNGGQMIMGIFWHKGPYLTQLCAAFLLISSRYVGMPTMWVVETLLSDKMSIFTDVVESMADTDLEAAERVLHIKCPNPLIDLEWRVIKMLIALHLTGLHSAEQQAAGGGGVFAKFDLAWLESMGFVRKMTSLVVELSPYAACRLMARTAQVMVQGGKSSSWSMITPLMDAFLQIPGIGPHAERYVFSASVAEAAKTMDPYEGDDAPSLLTKTLQFWAEVLGALSQKGYQDAVIFLENVLHSAAAAGRMHWPVVPGATFDAAVVWARSGKHFLAIAVASSVRPVVNETLSTQCAVGALIELAMNVIQDKALSLLCWDIVFVSLGADTLPESVAVRCANSCATIEKTFPLGNPVRKAYALMAESLRKRRMLPATPAMSDSSVRRFIWGKFAPSYKIGASVTAAVQQQQQQQQQQQLQIQDEDQSAASFAKKKQQSLPRFPEYPVSFLSLLVGKITISGTNFMAFCSSTALDVSGAMLRMEALEKDFITACRGMYQVISSKAVVSCGPMCRGGVEVSFDTMSQTSESLRPSIANREEFVRACSSLWSGAARLASSSFVLKHCAFPNKETAAQVLESIVSLSAEKLFPDQNPLVLAAKEALRFCGGVSIPLSIHLIRSFVNGCRKRFISEESGLVAQELHGDAQLARLDFLLALIVPETQWIASPENALALLEAVRLVFVNAEVISSAETRRILNFLGLENAIRFLIATDKCLPATLRLVCHFLASPEYSVIFMNQLSDRSFLGAVGVAVAATECWSLGCGQDVVFQDWKVTIDEMSSAPPAWQPSWFESSRIAGDVAVEAPIILRLFIKVLGCKRKPAGLIVSVRRALPALISSSSWSEIEHVLRLCALTGETAVVETAELINKCAPDANAAMAAWVAWFSIQVCTSLGEEAVSRVIKVFATSWSRVSWDSLKPETLFLFLREVVRTGCTSQRRRAFFESLSTFRPVVRSAALASEKIMPVVLVSMVRGIWSNSPTDAAELIASAACDWVSLTAAQVEALPFQPEMLSEFVVAVKGASSKGNWETFGALLEAARDGCLKTENAALSMYWLNAAAAAPPSVPLTLRVMVPLCRKNASAAACRVLLTTCTSRGSEESDRLKSVLQTFVSSVPDPRLCLVLLQVIPAQINNPKLSAPLTEGLLHSYLACTTAPNALEIAAHAWTPPSLPESNRNEFPIHDVSAATVPSLGLTLMLILERQRLVSPAPDQSPSQWADCFATPSLQAIVMFQVDPVRPFDLVGLWVWALQAIFVPFRPGKHAELSKIVVNFISQLDDLWQGYDNNAFLPVFLKDRMELAAGVCAMLAVRLTVETVNGDKEKAGVNDRIAQLSAKAKQFKCDELVSSFSKSVPEVCIALFQHLLPMGSYLDRVVTRERPPPPARTSERIDQAPVNPPSSAEQ